MTQTHTYATLDISREAYKEIREKLIQYGYSHAIHAYEEVGKEIIDMHGIGLQCNSTDVTQTLHECALRDISSNGGHIIGVCYERADGTLWIKNDEYTVQIYYCPLCGEKAKTTSASRNQ